MSLRSDAAVLARRRIFGVLRLLAAVTGVIALVARFDYGLGFSAFASANFFAYLTVQSNMVAVVANVACGIVALRRASDPWWMPGLRTAVTSFLIVAGIVFAILAAQASERGYRLDVPWSDQILHYWLPAYLLLDWLLAPGERRVSWRILAVVIGYPVGWGVVTLIRGPLVGWYPYFFLDPAQVSGFGEFALLSLAALALFALIASLLILEGRFHPLRRLESAIGMLRLSRAGTAPAPRPPRRWPARRRAPRTAGPPPR